MNVKLAELLGMMCGDGCLSKTQQGKHFVYCSGNRLKDKEYFGNYVPNLFLTVFGKTVVAHERETPKIIYIKFSDKQLFYALHELELPIGTKYEQLKIPQLVLEKEEYKLAFIRGLFDTDGCVVFSKQHRGFPYYPRIEITSKSHRFLLSVFLGVLFLLPVAADHILSDVLPLLPATASFPQSAFGILEPDPDQDNPQASRQYKLP